MDDDYDDYRDDVKEGYTGSFEVWLQDRDDKLISERDDE